MRPLQASWAFGFLIVAASYNVSIEPSVAGADLYQSPAATALARTRRSSQKPVNAAGAATKAFLDRLARVRHLPQQRPENGAAFDGNQ